MLVRRERPDDLPSVRALHAAAFGSGSGPVVEVRLLDELRADGDLLAPLCLVAEDDGEVVGHVTCSRGSVQGRPAVGLGPLGVLPEHQRRGVGTALLHAVLGAADALDEPAVLLLGSVDYYRRFGFAPAAASGVESPEPAWGDHFQLRRLSSWDGSLIGAFRYAPAFERL